MEVVESKKFTTKFGNKVNLVIRAGSMTARKKPTNQQKKPYQFKNPTDSL